MLNLHLANMNEEIEKRGLDEGQAEEVKTAFLENAKMGSNLYGLLPKDFNYYKFDKLIIIYIILLLIQYSYYTLIAPPFREFCYDGASTSSATKALLPPRESREKGPPNPYPPHN